MIIITDQSKQALIDQNVLPEKWGERRWELLNRLNSAGVFTPTATLAQPKTHDSSRNLFLNAILPVQIRFYLGHQNWTSFTAVSASVCFESSWVTTGDSDRRARSQKSRRIL
jgi:hypothetical protein